jgi:hypothetical protein
MRLLVKAAEQVQLVPVASVCIVQQPPTAAGDFLTV